MNVTLAGYKTYIMGAGMIAAGLATSFGLFSAIGLHIADDPMTLIMGGLGLIFARNGAKTEAKNL